MKAKTKGNVKTAEQAAAPERWDHPQLDTPLGRVELWLGGNPDNLTVRRAGWLELYARYPKPRRWAPPHLDKRACCALGLTPHIDTLRDELREAIEPHTEDKAA
jgi:hypothetical protein